MARTRVLQRIGDHSMSLMTTGLTTIFLVDDHTMIRSSLRLLLSQDGRFEVVGDTDDPRTAIERIAALRPRAILLDITMAGLSGMDLLPRIRDVHPAACIVMVTHFEGQAIVDRAFAAGADGFVSKQAPFEELVAAVWAALQGERQVARRGGTKTGSAAANALTGLTPREREVLQFLVLGKSNKEVGRTLGLSVSTIKKHREHLQRKLACRSSAELTRLAIREGLLEA